MFIRVYCVFLPMEPLIIANVAFLSAVVTLFVAGFMLRRRLFEEILYSKEVDSFIAEKIEELFTNPVVKRANTIIGRHGNIAKADAKAEGEFTDAILNQVAPEVPLIMERLGIDLPSEQLLPLLAKYGPLLQKFMGTGQKGGGSGHPWL